MRDEDIIHAYIADKETKQDCNCTACFSPLRMTLSTDDEELDSTSENQWDMNGASLMQRPDIRCITAHHFEIAEEIRHEPPGDGSSICTVECESVDCRMPLKKRRQVVRGLMAAVLRRLPPGTPAALAP